MGKLMLLLVAMVLMAVGIGLRRVIPESLLFWDRRTGYALYKRTLESTGDKERALQAAASFYKVFGAIFLIFGAVMLMVVIGMFLAN